MSVLAYALLGVPGGARGVGCGSREFLCAGQCCCQICCHRPRPGDHALSEHPAADCLWARPRSASRLPPPVREPAAAGADAQGDNQHDAEHCDRCGCQRTFLEQARTDRFYALWVLEATSGMRRCELAGAERERLDREHGTLGIETTRVVVNGKVIESDGKTENAQRVIALDPFTLAALGLLVEQLDRERAEFGPDYQDHGLLFCWEDGRPPHPDTITRRFKRLSAQAGLPLIDLHDVRHSYATAGRDAKIDWKALSVRIGHADVAFTMRQYVQADLEADRKVATALAELIIGGLLASVPLPPEQGAEWPP